MRENHPWHYRLFFVVFVIGVGSLLLYEEGRMARPWWPLLFAVVAVPYAVWSSYLYGKHFQRGGSLAVTVFVVVVVVLILGFLVFFGPEGILS